MIHRTVIVHPPGPRIGATEPVEIDSVSFGEFVTVITQRRPSDNEPEPEPLRRNRHERRAAAAKARRAA